MVRVYTSSVIDAPIESVWALIRSFDGLPKWHPGVEDCEIEQRAAPDRIGCVRAFKLRESGDFREKLLGFSEVDYSLQYAVLESPLALEECVAALKLTPVTDGDRTFAEWSADFECDLGREGDLAHVLGDEIFQGGFDALKERFG